MAEVNITISGSLTVDRDDAKRMKSDSAEDLLRALMLHDAPITVNVSEVTPKPKKA
jgi:hypothetical protein